MAAAHSDAALPAGGAAAPTATAASADRSSHPPKPRFALSVGIVGHRLGFWSEGQELQLERLQNVRSDVRAALEAVKAAAAHAHSIHKPFFDDRLPPELTVVSSLADGTDSIAAAIALDLDYKLDAPLPFPRSEYENGLKTAAAAGGGTPHEEFAALVAQARAVLALPGERRSSDGDAQGILKENRAYEAVGLTVISQSDILLAVWDHQLSRGRGGTAEIVAEAARAGIPIILVDANGTRPIELRWRGLKRAPAQIVAFDDLPHASLAACINDVIDEMVRPPRAPEQRQSLQRWYAENAHTFNFAFPFPALMAALLTRPIRCGDLFPLQPSELAAQYVKAASPAVDQDKPQLIAHLAEPYGWADAAAIYCAQFFRSAFVVNFLFAAFAVIAATGSVMMMENQTGWRHVPVSIEIVLIVCVVGNTLLGRYFQWHKRWVEARELAERLRVALPLWTLGLRPASFPGEEPTWTGWYARAVVRTQGLRCADLSAKKLDDERSVLLALLKDQRSYNHANAGRMRRMELRLELTGLCLLVATLLAAIDHLCDAPMVGRALGRLLDADRVIIWLSVALPALATATYGIRVIGDFEGIHQRGERTYRQLMTLSIAIKQDAGMELDADETAYERQEMAEGLQKATAETAAFEQDPIDFALLRARAGAAADAMLGDVASWRLAAESRGLAIPG
jgi:hypothetical protein